MLFVTHIDLIKPPTELAHFNLGDASRGEASWSADHEALFVPRLWLAPRVIRCVVNGGTLFQALSAMPLMQVRESQARYHRSPWSYCWGDLQVFETGSPVITRAIFLRGTIETPDLTIIGRYLREMPKPS